MGLVHPGGDLSPRERFVHQVNELAKKLKAQGKSLSLQSLEQLLFSEEPGEFLGDVLSIRAIRDAHGLKIDDLEFVDGMASLSA